MLSLHPEFSFTDTATGQGLADSLRDRLITYLKDASLPAGSKCLTDAELMRRSGLSRTTVRRALDELQRDGWIRREVGRGTFVAAVEGRPESKPAAPEVRHDDAGVLAASRSDVLRVAVLVLWQNSNIHDWYSPLVLRGIDQGAVEGELSVELLGHTESAPDQLRARLERSRPDVLVSLAGSLSQTLVIRDAQRLGIPVITVGASCQELALPTVREDNAQGMHLAYEHLRSHGHERIGLLLTMSKYPFVFERLAAFRACCESELGFDSGMIHWIQADGGVREVVPEADRLPLYLERAKPTAVISGSAAADRV